jgi:outer membrane protein assembly factor BamB
MTLAPTFLPRLLASCAVLGSLTLAGCSSSTEAPVAEAQPEAQLLEPDSFMASWSRDIPVSDYGVPERIFLRDDLVLVYTDQKIVYVLSAVGGRTLWVSRDVVGRLDRLWPPVLLEALNRFGSDVQRVVAFPTNTGYVIFSDTGTKLQETQLEQGERAITSPSFGYEGLAYVGLSDQYGGRAAVVDPTRLVNPIQVPVLLRGVVIGMPVVYDDTFFIADESGYVYAIGPGGSQAWGIERFETGAPVTAHLRADDHGLYVAGTDSILYVLDRETGHMKWRYFAEVPLFRPAFPTETHVFQPVEGRGVVALSKEEGGMISREPRWVAQGAIDVLSHDAQNVYLLYGDGRIAAHSKNTGEELFSTQRTDFTSFARNPNGAQILAATRSGEIVSIEPVLTRGRVGITVKAE